MISRLLGQSHKSPFKLTITLLLALIASATLSVSTRAQKPFADDRILFVSDRHKPKQFCIYSMKQDGTDQTRISRGDGIAFDPSWSPDHKQIVFSSLTTADKPTATLSVMKADGSDEMVLLSEGDEALCVAPAWSPDGKHIVYCAAKIGGALTSTIYVIDPDGKNRKKVADGIVPVWSPDSKRILFSATPKQGLPELKSVDIDGTNAKVLAAKGIGASWSPDGKRIAFTGEVDKDPTMFLMDPDGTHVTKIRQSVDNICIGPVWSADGSKIFFTQIPKDGGDRIDLSIWVMKADGSDAESVAKPNAFLGVGASMVFVMRAAGKG